MVLVRRNWQHHKNQFLTIVNEVVTIGNPSELAAIAAERKSFNAAIALRHSDRDRHHRLLPLGRTADMNIQTKKKRGVLSLQPQTFSGNGPWIGV